MLSLSKELNNFSTRQETTDGCRQMGEHKETFNIPMSSYKWLSYFNNNDDDDDKLPEKMFPFAPTLNVEFP